MILSGFFEKQISWDNVLLFSILAAAVSMVLLVQENNDVLLRNQMTRTVSGYDREVFARTCNSAENMLGLIAIAAVFIGAAGGLCLIGFRNQSAEKSIVMMHLFGMRKRDLAVKALLDAGIYALLSSCVGFCSGYLLFLHFSRRIMGMEISWTPFSLRSMALFSLRSAVVFLKTIGLIAFLIFLGNLYADLRITERSIAQTLYGRREERGKQKNGKPKNGKQMGGKNGGKQKIGRYILAAEMLGILLYSLLVFHVNAGYLSVAGVAAFFLAISLFSVFRVLFGTLTKKRRKNRTISRAKDLSFCFLCSRNKRDALLSIVMSMGTIFLCLASNVIFNMSGLLRSALQDNLGYTALIRVDDFGQKDLIRNRLDENGVIYTYIYSKLMDYSQLNHMGHVEGQFWALVIDSQTDGNRHFFVPENSFYAENYFASRCGLQKGQNSDLFGSPLACLGELTDNNQYLSFVNYNFLVNMEDWKLGIDDSWHAIFLINESPAGEKNIEKLLTDLSCHMRSPAELIGNIREMLLSIASGIDTPTSGSVRLLGKDFYKMESSRQELFRNENIRVLFQNYHLIPELTCEENIRMPLCFSSGGVTNEKKLDQWIRGVGLDQKRRLFPSQMSGGEQQRTALLRAIVNDPQILFADEPTGALDSKTGDGIIRFLIGYAHSAKKTILLVTHDTDIASQCDHVIEMADGSIA